MTTKKETYPVLPLRDLVMFPKMIVPLFVGRPRSIQALENTDPNKQILLIAQKDPSKDNPKINDVYKIGVVAKVLQMIRLQDSTVKILVEGIERVTVLKFFNDEYMTA